MAFDGLFTRAIVNELSDMLTLGKIDKIYQPEKNEIILHIHTSKYGKKTLYLSCDTNHCGAYITENSFLNPTSPSSFCMLLRKHLVNGRILDIKQRNWDRIIEISFETRDEMGFNVNKKLIVEIMGKHSNIILVDVSSNKIIDSIKRISIDVNRARQILPGMLYEYPPSQDKTMPENIAEDFFNTVSSSKDILQNILGISPQIAEELYYSSAPYDLLKNYISILNNREFTNIIYFKENNIPCDFHVFPLSIYNNLQQNTFGSVSETIEYYYAHRESSNRIKQKSSDLNRHINSLLKKLYHKKQNLLEDILQAKNSEKYKLYGELITANLYQINQGDSTCNVLNYYTGENISIPLDRRYSPSKNAQLYYKRYNKSKVALIEKDLQINQTNSDIDYLESVLSFIERADDIEVIENIREELIDSGYLRRKKTNKVTKKSKDISPYKYMTSDGFKVLVGRNNRENDILTLKKASRNDLWFHTKDIPGSHTILFTENKDATDNAIFEAAKIAAYHSKGQLSENVPVDYTSVKYVKKPSGAKPGMVIFTDNKTVYVTPKLPE